MVALYELPIVAAIWWLAAAIITVAGGGAAEPGTAVSFLVPALGLTLHLSYFCVSWRLSGQTLGMRAWRIQMVNRHGERLDWLHCLYRSLVAIPCTLLLMVGWLWMLVDRDACTLQDRLCDTRAVGR